MANAQGGAAGRDEAAGVAGCAKQERGLKDEWMIRGFPAAVADPSKKECSPLSAPCHCALLRRLALLSLP